jgi:hypothetical protein
MVKDSSGDLSRAIIDATNVRLKREREGAEATREQRQSAKDDGPQGTEAQGRGPQGGRG